MEETYPNGLKRLWEKDNLLVMSNLSSSHSVFKRLVLQTRKNQGLFGKGLTRSFFHFNKNKTISIFVNISLLYPGKMKVFRGILESAYLSIHVSVCPCVSPSVYKILVSVKALAGILSHI